MSISACMSAGWPVRVHAGVPHVHAITRLLHNIDLIPVITTLNPFTAGAEYIRVFILYYTIKYHILNMLKIK